MSSTQQPTLIRRSIRVYRLLLIVYPAAFRDAYSQQLVQVFGDLCRAALQRRGWRGLALLWMGVLYDLGRSSIREHVARKEPMTTQRLVRFSGLACLVGTPVLAAAVVLIRQASVLFLFMLVLLWLATLTGLALRYQASCGLLGRSGLYASGLGMGLFVVLVLLMLAVRLFSVSAHQLTPLHPRIIYQVARLLVVAGFIAFSTDILRTRAFQHWTLLPALMALLMLLLGTYSWGAVEDMFQALLVGCWMPLGYLAWSERVPALLGAGLTGGRNQAGAPDS